jgi:hypothetical protein
MRLVLETVLPRVRLRPAAERAERTHVRHITLVPARGTRVVAVS